MKPDFKRIKELFVAALELKDAGQRDAFLREACGTDEQLRAQVEVLLQRLEHAGNFLEEPVVERLLTKEQEPTPAALQGQVPPPPALVEGPGTQIGPFRLVEQIGEGGFGVVFKAEQQHPVRRTVALKILKPGMDTRHVIARFEAERQALALMDHSNIARVLDGGETGSGRPYFVMELVQGISITQYCDEHQLTPRERLALFVPVCQAVQHAHQKGIIHRDLKPSNVLIAAYDGKPVPKVIDFGVAKALGQRLTELTLVTGYGGIVGTLEYMSPEQAEFNALDIDTRADIYSLGVLLYELLTGTTPLTKKRLKEAAMTEVLRLIREEDPPRPSARLSDSGDSLASISAQRKLEPARLTREVRGELDWIVMKALEKDRSRRYETANELARDIERSLNDEPVEAGPPSAVYRLRKFTRRHKKLLATVTAFVLLLLAGATVSAWQAVRATFAERQARDHERLAILERDAKEKAREAEAEQHRQAVAAIQQAKEEAAIAKAVNEFLQEDLLRQADAGIQAPGATRTKDITVRELLDRAAREIPGRFKGQELTEAAIRLSMGRAYLPLGEYAQAEKHLERSLTLRKQKLGADHADTLDSMSQLGELYVATGRFEQAELTHKQVLEARRTKLGPAHVDTLMSINNLGQLYLDRGRYGAAEKLLDKAVAGFRAQLGTGHWHTLASMNNLAHLYHTLGRYDAAESLYKQTLAGWATREGADHPGALSCKSNLASLYLVRGRYDDAEPLFKQALEARRVMLGPDHIDTLASMNALAMLYRARGRNELAEPLCQQVLEGRRDKLGPGHPETLRSMNNLAAVYLDLARYDQGELLLKRVVEGWRATLGPDHPDTLTSMSNLAMFYRARERYDLAESLLQQAQEGLRAKFGPDHASTMQIAFNLAGLYLDRARYAEAEPLFKQVLAGRRARLGADHPDTLATMNALALLHSARGEYDGAEPLFREAVAAARKRLGLSHALTQRLINNQADLFGKQGQPQLGEPPLRELAALFREKAGPDSPRYASQLTRLSQNLLDQKKYAEAESVARDSGAILAKSEPNVWTTFRVQALLGGALLLQKKYAEAEPLLMKGCAGMREHKEKIPRKDKDKLIEALERLVQLYDAWDKKTEAATWRKELEDEKARQRR